MNIYTIHYFIVGNVTENKYCSYHIDKEKYYDVKNGSDTIWSCTTSATTYQSVLRFAVALQMLSVEIKIFYGIRRYRMPLLQTALNLSTLLARRYVYYTS